jgi:hypothetical protein
MASMANTVWSGVRANTVYDVIKEGAKLMLPFIAGLGVKPWITEHSTGLMWAGAFTVAAVIAFWDHRSLFSKEEPPERTVALTVEQISLVKDADNQLWKINRFQWYALSRLSLTAGKTENQFYQEILDLGFPIGSLMNQRIVERTFSDISGVTTFVENEPQSSIWKIRDRYRLPLDLIFKQRGPMIG